jgi:hypothetical protein
MSSVAITFYCSGRRRWNFSGLFFMLSKNLFVGMGGKLRYSFVGVVIITLINDT